MRKTARISCAWIAIVGAISLTFAGCYRRSGEAIVLSKEHIPVAEITASPSPLPSVSEATNPEVEPENTPVEEAEVVTEEELGPDLRGTSKDPRAVDHEQWVATVRMVSDRRLVEVRVDPQRWATLKEGDRVRVRYRVGKYTGTVWSSELE